MSYQGRKDIEMINLGAYLHNTAVLHFNKLFLLYHNVDSVARFSPEFVVKFDSLTAYEIQLYYVRQLHKEYSPPEKSSIYTF